MKYQQPPAMSRQELEAAFRSENGIRIREALISASYSEEGNWLAGWCLHFVNHPAWEARQGAAMVLGYVAMDDWRSIDPSKCLEAVERLTGDLQEEVKVAARDAVEDVLQAMRLNNAS
jgi:hypothetical protein